MTNRCEKYIGLYIFSEWWLPKHYLDQEVDLCVTSKHKKATPIGKFAGLYLFRFHITRMKLQGRVSAGKAQKMF